MINRRNSLGLIGAGLLANACGASSSPISKTKPLQLDPNVPEDLYYMHRKLAYSLDENQLTYWNIEALRMGMRDGILTPFWKLHVGIVYKCTDLGPHRYENKAILKIFYTDLETGKLLESFDNPYTGKTHEAQQPRLFKTTRIFGMNGVEHDDKDDDIFRDDRLGPVRIIGDDIWLNADSILRSEPPNRRNKLVQVNDWSTYLGSMRDVTNPDLMSAPATHTFNDLNTFNSSWSGMDDVENIYSISRGFGRKSHSPDALPEIWKNFVRDTHPELLTDRPGF